MEQELTLNLMNTTFYIKVSNDGDKAWKEHVENWLQYVASQWSRFRNDNELAQLNELPIGQILTLSPALYDCLQLAHSYYQLTDGLFSPYLKKQMEQNGYAQTLEKTKSTVHQPVRLSELTTDAQPIEFLHNNQVKKRMDVEVDLGGIAKGYAVEKTAQLLKELGFLQFGLVDGGGDITVWSAGEKEWTISIADPFDQQQDATFLKIKNGAIATSNRIFRSWLVADKPKHHILNGQTGEVAETIVAQASIVTSSLIDAEVGTKLSFLMDEQKLQQNLSRYFGQTACYIVNDEGIGKWLLMKGE